ncbi:Hypothetical Protein FCC1311_097392 [Hondaea fermentalgiana]|uniref:Uncharacterized protein n=1 Tax=Hondaea fermentalgiana TaxID=2315210 RepID=A0A2R5GRK4_9STRA|nr:Hypothetical Protein FCC1311_097392 [Hondaea fermentalgiana]|eukprot:GBG33516.1 Hypothetical Protein FCC1311_097392 [Hondaea fermentalgiana]
MAGPQLPLRCFPRVAARLCVTTRAAAANMRAAEDGHVQQEEAREEIWRAQVCVHAYMHGVRRARFALAGGAAAGLDVDLDVDVDVDVAVEVATDVDVDVADTTRSERRLRQDP